MNLERTDLLTAIKDFNLDGMNRNTLGEVFLGGRFRREVATRFAFFTYPQPQVKKGVPFTPIGFDFQDTQKNLGSIDKNEISVQMSALVKGDSDSSNKLIRIQQSFEEFRKELVFEPLVEIEFKDTVYQIYNGGDSSGEVEFAWEAETEYTVFTIINNFSGGTGFILVDGIQTDVLSVIIPPSTTGIFKQKFTTGEVTLELHRQFMPETGGTIELRTAIVKGDFLSLDDETITSIVEAKDRSGNHPNLVDNDNDFENWNFVDVTTIYTVDTYTGSSTCTFNNQTGGIISWNNDDYSIVTMTTTYNLSKGLIDSNEGIIKLRVRNTQSENEFITLTFNTATFGNVKTMDSDQKIAVEAEVAAKSRGIKRFRDIKIDLKLQNEQVFNEVLNEIIGSAKVNTQYDIEITFFDGGTTYPKIVILESSGITLIRGEQQTLQLQFKEYLV